MASRNCACGSGVYQNGCNCSLAEPFPLLGGMGGAFADSGIDNMNSSIITLHGNDYGDDPRNEESIFGDMPPLGRSAPSSMMRGGSFSKGQIQHIPISMNRNHSSRGSMSSQGYVPEVDRAPVRARFAQLNSDQMLFSTPHGTTSSTYREAQQGPGSFTESSQSHGRFSHRSSDASNYKFFPGTPSTDVDMNFGDISLSSSPIYRDTFSPRDNPFAAGSYEHSDYLPTTSMTHPMAPPMDRTRSSTSQKAKIHWCEFPGCSHGRAFGTRNDLDRHKLAVHKIVPPGSSTKVYVCQGTTCQQQGKDKIWPRKDNFKNHCKVAHQDVDLDSLIARSERLSSSLKPNEIEGLQADEPAVAPHRDTQHVRELDPALCKPIISISCDTASAQHHSNRLPPPSPEYLSPDGTRRYSLHHPCEKSQSVSSVATVHRRSISQPNPPGMERNFSDPTNGSSLSASLDQNITNEELLNLLRSRNILPQNLIDATLGSNKQGTKRRSDGSVVTDTHPQRCKDCNKGFRRPCDLKKHETRHSKPWGCTNKDCNKIFGSKNDWKRHENLRHFQAEAWICGFVDTESVRCIETFAEKDNAVKHCCQHYPEKPESDVQEIVRKGRIGRNWEGAFWCGFCQKVMKLKKKNLDAWDERFDHIDAHLWGRFRLSQEQKEAHPDLVTNKVEDRRFAIDDWVPPHTLLTKAQIKDEKRLSDAKIASGDQPPSSEGDEDGDCEDDDEQQCSEEPDAEGLPDEQSSTSDVDACNPSSSSSDRAIKKLHVEYTWWCRGCGGGPMKTSYQESCPFCQKHRDGNDEVNIDN